MTNSQQQEILRLKASGLSFSQISTRVGLPRNTIKSFWQRCRAVPEQPTSRCEQCGQPVASRRNRAQPRFCSDRCRSAWWNAHREQFDSKDMTTVPCACCGKPIRFFPSQHRVYCSRECYFDARYGGNRHDD